MSDEEQRAPGAIVVDLTQRIEAREGFQPPLVSVPGHKSEVRCMHHDHTVVIDKRARKTYCRGCKTELDPYDALDRLSRSGDRYEELRRRREELRENVSRLLAEERRTKARLRNARTKLKAIEAKLER